MAQRRLRGCQRLRAQWQVRPGLRLPLLVAMPGRMRWLRVRPVALNP
jgi:hypothetical protein